MKILITGATGIVGKPLVEKLCIQNIPIHFLTTKKSKQNDFSVAKGFHWNPKKNQIDESCFEGVTHLIHLAGASISKRWTVKYKREIRESRVLGTLLLSNTLKRLNKKHTVKHVVAASAVGCYPSDFDHFQDESAKVNDHSFLSSVVLDWENTIDDFESLNITVTKLRIGLVLSTSGGIIPALKWPTKLGILAAIGNGKQGQSWIHVYDLVDLFVKATQEGWNGTYNAVAPNPVTQNEFMKQLASAFGRFVWLPPIPKFVIRMLYGSMSILLFNSHWIKADKVLKRGFKFTYFELNKALTNLI
tara:strand:- start:2410 stop:3318 length:909 start_codon:yes stop_codon:yes gene_type:complete